MPPSVDKLIERLKNRGSESEESLKIRIEKAEKEIARHSEFDLVIVNDNFNIACQETKEVITNFIKS